MASGPITSWEIDGEIVETVSDFIFLGSQITADGDCSHEIKRRLLLGRKVMTNLDSILKSRESTLQTKVHLVKAMVFPVVRYGCELDCEESWVPKNGCFWTAVLEKTLESPLDCKEIQPVHSEGDQPWVFFGGNDAEAETPVLWPPHAKSWLIGKDADAWEGLGAGGERDDRGWDGWMASPTQCTWVWLNSVSWWWTGRPGMLWIMRLPRVRHDWVTELNWAELFYILNQDSGSSLQLRCSVSKRKDFVKIHNCLESSYLFFQNNNLRSCENLRGQCIPLRSYLLKSQMCLLWESQYT